MAGVEWAKVLAFDTADIPVIDPQKIARRDPAKLRLKLQPYVQLMTLRFPIERSGCRLAAGSNVRGLSLPRRSR